MISNSIFDTAHLDHLKTALDAYSGRQKVVADNIANVETQGYKAREYRFEDLLRKAQGNRLRGVRTDADHLPIGRRDISETRGEAAFQDSGHDNGVNDVNIDAEMTELATTELSYRLATRVLSMKYNQLREAVSGRVR